MATERKIRITAGKVSVEAVLNVSIYGKMFL